MGCGCNKNKKKIQSSRMPVGETIKPKRLTPNQRRSKTIKIENARKKAERVEFQKKQEKNQKLWEQYRNK